MFLSNSDYAKRGEEVVVITVSYNNNMAVVMVVFYGFYVVIIVIVPQRTGTLVLAGMWARPLKLTYTWHPTVVVNR